MPSARIELRGLDAANLLGYLAALGTLRSLTLADPDADVRLSWTEDSGWWMAVLHHSRLDEDGVFTRLADYLGKEVNPAWTIASDLTIVRETFASLARDTGARAATGDPAAQAACAFFAAFGSDGNGASGKPTLIADTAFRTMSGAGHQHFLGFMRELQATTNEPHIRAALLRRWEYTDEKPSMRWDPNDFRPHALRAEDPSTDPIRTVRGANRLAIEALPLFPTAPTTRGLLTAGFKGDALEYPVWRAPLDLHTVGSLLTIDEPWETLRARGVEQVFRTVRFTEGKYRNFSPSEALH